MFFVINAEDCVKTGNWLSCSVPLTEYVYLLDTDDLVVERVQAQKLLEYSGKIVGSGTEGLSGLCIEVPNISRSKNGLFIDDQICFFEYLELWDKQLLVCMDGRVRYALANALYINNVEVGIRCTMDIEGLCVYAFNECVCAYNLDIEKVRSGLAYMYRCNDYLVARWVTLLKDTRGVCTTFIFSLQGDLIDVIADSKFESVVHIKSKDPIFSSKFKVVYENKY